MKKVFFVFVVALFVITACSKDDNPISGDDSLIGTWILTQESMDGSTLTLSYSEKLQLNSDKTFIDITNDFTDNRIDTTFGSWSANNGKLTAVGSHGTLFSYEYKVEGSSLTLTDRSQTPHIHISIWKKQ